MYSRIGPATSSSPARRDQRLGHQVTAAVLAPGQAPANLQQQVGDRPTRVGGEQVGQDPPAVRAQRGHQQLGLRAEMRVQRAVFVVYGAGVPGCRRLVKGTGWLPLAWHVFAARRGGAMR